MLQGAIIGVVFTLVIKMAFSEIDKSDAELAEKRGN